VDHPFQRWIDLARPHAQLWRTALGIVLVVAAWAAWTYAVGYLSIALNLTTLDAISGAMGEGEAPLGYFDLAIGMAVLLATFWGLWIGVWIATKAVHGRGFSTVLSHNGRLLGGQFMVGMVLAAGYLAISLGATWLSGAPPVRSSVELDQWLLASTPLLLLLLFQTGGEELFFRGYLTQQIAARLPNPIAWGLVPSVAFGLGHIGNGMGHAQFEMYYFAATMLMGLTMTAMVWRTGGLAAAMGFHLMNNIGAMLLVGIAGVTPPISLFVMDFSTMMGSAPTDLLVLGLLLAFVLSPFAPLPKGQPLRRK
jgi:uncharacterized protein